MKALNLLSLKKWINSFVGRMILNKTFKHAMTAIIGMAAGAKLQSILATYGVILDVPKLTVALQGLCAGIIGAILNWAQQTIDTDGDGIPDQ